MGIEYFKYQPLRGLYLTYQLFTTAFIRLPLWTLISLPRLLRPRPSWSFTRSIIQRLTRQLNIIFSTAGPLSTPSDYTALSTGPDIKGLWIPPAPDALTASGSLPTWSDIAGVSSIPLPGYWLDRPGSSLPISAPPMPGEKVLYCLHGGGYTALSAHPRDPSAAIPRGLLTSIHSIQRAFSVEYRLSAPGRNPFPAALLDALAGYAYLVNTVGFSPADIILEGDSAGGNLALALTRYLVEHAEENKQLPAPPGALVLLSPWADLGPSHAKAGSALSNRSSDFLLHTEGPSSFVGPLGHGAAEFNRYISPASHAIDVRFAGFPPTFIAVGGAEILLDQGRTLRDRMVADMGKSAVCYVEEPDAMHNWLVVFWHEPERGRTLEAIGEWVGGL